MIDKKLQAELRAKFNPDGSDLRKMQLRMLDMLKYIDKICRENNITYWLSSGTCLGAVRHGGFIPWDDDCDIEMERKDYKRLINILQETSHPQFVLQNYNTDSNYIHNYSKLRDLNSEIEEISHLYYNSKYNGCFIDIFSIEPSYSLLSCRIAAYLWYRQRYFLKIKNPKLRNIIIKYSRMILSKFIYPIIRCGKVFSKQKDIYRHTLGVRFFKERFKKDIENIRYVDFENVKLPIPSNYHSYLTHIYNDYLNLPNLNEIELHSDKVVIY